MEFNGMLLGFGVLRELPKIKTASSPKLDEQNRNLVKCFLAPEWLDACMGNMEKIIEELK